MPIRPSLNPNDANEIANAEYKDDSVWHFQLAATWIAYAEINRTITGLIYGAIHVRLGIERLWYEIFEVALNFSLSEKEDKKAIGNATELYKLIEKLTPSYYKYIEFTEVLREIDSSIGPPIARWDLRKLARVHGECSNRLLHFSGTEKSGFGNDEWWKDQLGYLGEVITWIIEYSTRQGNLVIYRPDDLQKPEIFDIWVAFESGKTDVEGVKVRERLINHRLPRRHRIIKP